jgi:hypothetical protein
MCRRVAQRVLVHLRLSGVEQDLQLRIERVAGAVHDGVNQADGGQRRAVGELRGVTEIDGSGILSVL